MSFTTTQDENYDESVSSENSGDCYPVEIEEEV
jgi:hypothetical protein